MHGFGDGLRNLLLRRPHVLEVDRLAVLARPERLGLEVHVHAAGQGVGDDQRRRGEVIRPHFGMDAPLEVAVAAQHGRHDEAVVGDRLGYRLRQRSAVPDARGAAVADQVEAQRLQRPHQAGLDQVVGDDLGAGRQARLDPRLRLQALLDGLLRQEAGRHHHRRVGRVGAAGDGRDHDGAVMQVLGRRVPAGVSRVRGGRRRDGRAFADLLGDGPFHVAVRRLRLGLAGQVGQGGAERLLHVAQPHAVLRPLRPGQARFDRRQIQLHNVRIRRLRRRGGVEEALLLGVRLDQPDERVGPAGEAEVAQRLGVHGEDAAGGAVLRGHVGDGGAVGQRQVGQSRAEELHELADDALLAQHLGDGQHEVGGRGRLPAAGP